MIIIILSFERMKTDREGERQRERDYCQYCAFTSVEHDKVVL